MVEEPVEDLTRDLDSLVIEEATEGETGLDLKKVSQTGWKDKPIDIF